RLQFATRLVDVEHGERHIMGTGTGDQHVIDRRRQRVEEPPEPVKVGRVESGNAAFDLKSGALHALGIARRDDHLGSLRVCSPSGREAYAGTPADHQKRLTGEFGDAPHHAASSTTPGASLARAKTFTSSL